jgi:hypothetical protein
MTPEGRVKKQVDKELKVADVWYFKPVSTGHGKHGIPDYICCVPVTITPDMVGKTVGMFVGIETKPGDKQPTDRQKLQMRLIRKASGIAVLVNEKTFVNFKKLVYWLTKNNK